MLLRLAIASFLIHNCFYPLPPAADDGYPVLPIIAAAAGVFLLVGLWTPVAGILVSLTELCIALLHIAEPSSSFLAAAVALGLALLGPGSWSIDARNYGRKRISIGNR